MDIVAPNDRNRNTKAAMQPDSRFWNLSSSHAGGDFSLPGDGLNAEWLTFAPRGPITPAQHVEPTSPRPSSSLSPTPWLHPVSRPPCFAPRCSGPVSPCCCRKLPPAATGCHELPRAAAFPCRIPSRRASRSQQCSYLPTAYAARPRQASCLSQPV
jgi:hypothetical protein